MHAAEAGALFAAVSNGTIALAVAAAVLLAVFAGRTHTLIPLHAVGVFVAFTFSQVGMVVHWWRRRDEHWHRSMLLNGVGAALSAVVFVIAASPSSATGRGSRATDCTARSSRLAHPPPLRHRSSGPRPLSPRALRAGPSDRAHRLNAPDGNTPPLLGAEDDESPDQLQHLAVVPIVRLDLSGPRALAYAASLGLPVLAVHISAGDDEAARFKSHWAAWGDHLPLEVVDSPYWALVAPLARYIHALRTQRSELTLTVVLPELIVKHRWQQLLHNGTARRLRRALRHQPGVVITTIPLSLST